MAFSGSTSSGCPTVDCGWVVGFTPEPTAFSVDIDLTGYTVVVQLLQPDGTFVQRTAVIDTATATGSTFHVNWEATDVQSGTTRARLILTNASGQSTLGGEFSIEAHEEWT